MPTSALILNAGHDAVGFKPAIVLGQGLPSYVNGVTARYFWKRMLPLGRFRTAQGVWEEVTPQRIDTIMRDFDRAKIKGYLPYLPPGHRDRSKNYGYVLELRKGKDGALEGLHQVIGDDAIIEVARNQSSICTLRDVTDEHGEHYDELLDHNAILPDPQLSGLGPFIPIDVSPALAASRGRPLEATVFELSAALQETDMDLTALRKALGAADTVPDADVITQATAKLGTIPALVEAASTAATDKVTALSRERDEAKAQLAKTTTAPPAPDPEVLADRAELCLSRIDLAIERGDMPKFVADKLRKAIKPEPGAPSVFMLSREPSIGARPVDFVLSLFDGAKLGAATGEKSGAQILNLSRTVPDGNDADNDKPITEERKRALIEMGGGTYVAVK